MDYLVGLKDLRTGYEQEIEVAAEMPLPLFADEVRREMELGYDENVYTRQTLACGKIFMRGDAIENYVDNLWEGADDPNDLLKRADIYNERTYAPEESVRVQDLFTVIGSAFTYRQGSQRVRCTLLERYED